MNNNSEDNLIKIWQLMIPNEFRSHFELESFRDDKKEFILNLVEIKDNIPKDLLDIVWWDTSKVVLDWYCRPIELMDFPVRDKSTFIILTRRKWKLNLENSIDNLYKDKSFNNEYFFNFDWMKTTKKFGLFLKELTRDELDELFRGFPAYKHFLKETI